jgi:hypothetical protein
MNKDKIKKEIDELSLFEDNWDSYGALSFTKKLLDKAKNIIDGLDNKYSDPQVIPCCSPSVDFEWSNGENELEIAVMDDSIVYLKVVGKDDKDWKEGYLDGCDEINEMLEWLYGEKNE